MDGRCALGEEEIIIDEKEDKDDLTVLKAIAGSVLFVEVLIGGVIPCLLRYFPGQELYISLLNRLSVWTLQLEEHSSGYMPTYSLWKWKINFTSKPLWDCILCFWGGTILVHKVDHETTCVHPKQCLHQGSEYKLASSRMDH